MRLLLNVMLEHAKACLPYRKKVGRLLKGHALKKTADMEAVARERLWHLEGLDTVDSLYEFGVGEDGISLLSDYKYFYRYGTKVWPFFQSRNMYQNRLRHSDIENMAKAAGFRIEQQERTPADTKELPPKIAGVFSKYDREDLLTARTAIRFRKPNS